MKLKALVIDDSRVMRNMVMQNLNKTRLAEFEFVEAEDGEDALSKFDADSIDIAFVDWNMPKMTGIDFVRQVRALGNTDHIAMVMVTSEKTMGKIEEALDEAGANAYICKPFTVEDLVRKLQPLFEEIAASRGDSEASNFLSRLFG
jgi:two-component system chemotaxis response regulator CheY